MVFILILYVCLNRFMFWFCFDFVLLFYLFALVLCLVYIALLRRLRIMLAL